MLSLAACRGIVGAGHIVGGGRDGCNGRLPQKPLSDRPRPRIGGDLFFAPARGSARTVLAG